MFGINQDMADIDAALGCLAQYLPSRGVIAHSREQDHVFAEAGEVFRNVATHTANADADGAWRRCAGLDRFFGAAFGVDACRADDEKVSDLVGHLDVCCLSVCS